MIIMKICPATKHGKNKDITQNKRILFVKLRRLVRTVKLLSYLRI